MSDNPVSFTSARDEADKIEHLAKVRMDTVDTLFNNPTAQCLAADKALADEWASLTFEQRVDTMNSITRYDNQHLDGNPVPTFVHSDDGKAMGLDFTSSTFDWHFGPHTIELKAENGHVTVSHSRVSVPWTVFVPDCTIAEPHGTFDETYHGPPLNQPLPLPETNSSSPAANSGPGGG